MRRDLCDEQALIRAGFPDRRPLRQTPGASLVGDNQRLPLLVQYLTDAALFDRGREIVWISPGEDGDQLAKLQAELRRKLGALGITVEVNPTSNLLIGDLEDLTGHPMWRLRPPRPGPEETNPVAVCVGTDNPLTFNSNLRAEYQCLSDAMLLAGLSDEESRRWLDRTRDCSLESRFTIARDMRFNRSAVDSHGLPLTNSNLRWFINIGDSTTLPIL
ncbi:MAG: hypothetical protein JSS02_13595 [Planctomycetes bacterium]|nr:hypothetical protein [Planctomycetota bacterium]